MKKLSLKPRKLIAGKYFGQFQSIFSGIGTEASDIRPYTPGDSAKMINWKTSAKSQQLFSNVYHQEKAIAIDMLRDVNYNRNGELQKKKNYERVREVVSDVLLYAKTYGGMLTIFSPNKSGFFSIGTKLKINNVGKNYDQAVDLMTQLSAISKSSSKTYHTHISDFLSRMATNKKRRAIIIFSDFLGIDDKQVKQLQQVKKEHTLLLFQLPVNEQMGQNYDATMVNEKKNT